MMSHPERGNLKGIRQWHAFVATTRETSVLGDV